MPLKSKEGKSKEGKSKTPVPAIKSASAMIIRDGQESAQYGTLEILMVKRHHNIQFAGGAYVFPGGKVDSGDGDLRLTALREVFEETGLVIGAYEGGEIGEVKHRELVSLYRDKFLGGTMQLPEFVERSGVKFILEDCLPFAHWITPENYPKRFDTYFFLCRAPEGQEATPDGGEMVEARWVKPLALVEDALTTMMFPTAMNLKKLGRARNVEEAFDNARRAEIVTVLPEIKQGSKGEYRIINEAADYDDVDQSRVARAMKDVKSEKN